MSFSLGCVAENTPKYLGQALRLVQSVRWFGGALNEGELYVCVVDDISPDYRMELERYGATIRIVPRFSTKHPQSNKLRFLELPDLSRHDQILLLDCDTIVVRDPSPHLFRSDFTAKIVDVSTVPLDIFRRLFAAFGTPIPVASQRCTVSDESTIPYFNAGVLAFSRRGMDTLVPKWIDLNLQLIGRMELLEGHNNFCEQASLSLALAATGVPFKAVGNAFNFPMHFDAPASAPGLADTDPFIVHYHWLADPSGFILPSSYPAVNRRIDDFNARLRKERESWFDNRLFWNQRYAENPELGSGIGSRGGVRDYKRDLLTEATTRWQPRSILDVGCGDLEVGSALPAEGYTGLDFSEVVVAANQEKYPDRAFLAGNFMEMETPLADMVVCLDVLIHLASPDDYRNFVHKLVHSTRKVCIVAGDEADPALGSIVFYHEPLSRTLAEAGATNIRKIGAYRHVTIFEFTPPPLRVQYALIVLGMHRSGTSALSGALSLLGVQPGDNLVPAMEDVNPKGFWEHAEIVSIHDNLLEALNSSWDDESPLPEQWWQFPFVADYRSKIICVLNRDFGNRAIWLLKDPRMCRLLPFWQDVLREFSCQPLFILTLRDPAEVALSLRKRNDIDEIESCLLWLTHMLEAEYQTRDQPRAFLTNERLLSDWRGALADVGKTLCLNWPVPIEVASPSVDAFIDPSLRHHRGNTTLPSHPACRLAQEVFELLSAPSHNLLVLDQMRTRASELALLAAPLSKIHRACKKQNHVLLASVISLETEKAALNKEIMRIKNTASWQMTKPLRFVWNALSRLSHSSSPKS